MYLWHRSKTMVDNAGSIQWAGHVPTSSAGTHLQASAETRKKAVVVWEGGCAPVPAAGKAPSFGTPSPKSFLPSMQKI